jgi:hypothetical protein
VNDLRHRRVQDYKFSWSKALNPRCVFHLFSFTLITGTVPVRHEVCNRVIF